MIKEDYFFEYTDIQVKKKVFALVIYDIVDNATRNKFSKFMEGFGKRVQKSAFEVFLSVKKYDKLILGIPSRIKTEDSVRVYRMTGTEQVLSWGVESPVDEDIILV